MEPLYLQNMRFGYLSLVKFLISLLLYAQLFSTFILKSALSLSFCILEMRNGSFITEGQLVMLLLL